MGDGGIMSSVSQRTLSMRSVPLQRQNQAEDVSHRVGTNICFHPRDPLAHASKYVYTCGGVYTIR